MSPLREGRLRSCALTGWESLAINLRSLFDVFLPIPAVWGPGRLGGSMLPERGPQISAAGGRRSVREPIAHSAILRAAAQRAAGVVSTEFAIIQQCFVTGWGGLRSQAALVPAPAPALQSASLSAKRTRRARTT